MQVSDHNCQLVNLPNIGPNQILLHKLLSNESPRLAKMYFGALHVISQDNNPDRCSLAAHALRELMEKFPEYVNIQIHSNAGIAQKINELQRIWEKAQTSSCNQDGFWSGGIDHNLELFLKCVDEFFKWRTSDVQFRRRYIQQALQKLDAAHKCLPDKITNIATQRWTNINKYFQNVAHHRHEATMEDFMENLNSLEEFLIAYINPKTFSVLDEIDRIIGCEKSNANK